jgi:hypothetical protein
MNYIEKNTQSIINLLLNFSFIVFIANFFIFNHTINTVLYFSNIMSFFGFSAMIWLHPEFYFNKYQTLFLGNINKYGMNAIGLGLHLTPIYLFKHRQTIAELLDINIIIYSAGLALLYYIIFKSELPEYYPSSESELFTIIMSFLGLSTIVSMCLPNISH